MFFIWFCGADQLRLRLTHETSFVRAHISVWTKLPFFFYVVKKPFLIFLPVSSNVLALIILSSQKQFWLQECFLRQFFVSVGRTDYLTLRHGFISVSQNLSSLSLFFLSFAFLNLDEWFLWFLQAHLAPGRQFNFQGYINKSLEDDFKLIVGIRYNTNPIIKCNSNFASLSGCVLYNNVFLTLWFLLNSPVLWASFVIFLLFNVNGELYICL